MGILTPFVLEDFDRKKPFSSFLPGVAGLKGVPLWTYYANRGQGITSVGSKDKNGSIIEFNPACIAYEKVSTQGFRTFIKINNQEVIEIFGPRDDKNNVKRTMYITGASFSIEEENIEKGYRYTVKYFGLSNMPLGALVRRVELVALKDNFIFELLDGTTQVLPQGISNGAYKDCGNLMRSWIDVYHMDDNTPFYTMRASSSDEAEVKEVDSGNFFLAKFDNQLMKTLSDLEVIFGYDSSRTIPVGFKNKSIENILNENQYVTNKIPCAFVGIKKTLNKNEKINIDEMLGYLPSYQLLKNNLPNILKAEFFSEKEIEAEYLIKDLTDDVKTTTNYPLFDEYLRQSYLDNFLRGGYPVSLGKNKPTPYYIYSRKHGDPERDYNWFNLEPEYYSQGNGNFRDVNQNRRNDVIFNNFLKDKNIKLFMNLIALDGYNPLVINGSTYLINEGVNLEDISRKILGNVNQKFINLFKYHFTPGAVINFFEKEGLTPIISDDEILDIIFENSTEQLEAVFGEGYWVDHFTYNLDLIETYLYVYPEKEQELLFKNNDYRYFYNPVYVLPRSEKIGLTKDLKVRQYGSTKEITNEEKTKINYSPYHSNWAKNKDGKILEVNLAAKLISLIVTKFTSRDPFGYGLMMEANKPGWNDAMNGLPGLLSSGVSESLELKRIIDYTINTFKKYSEEHIKLPLELSTLIYKIKKYLIALNNREMDQAEYFNLSQDAIELYREQIRLGQVSDLIDYQAVDFLEMLSLMQKEIKDSIGKLKKQFDILPTYISYVVVEYDRIEGLTPYGLQKISPKKYEMNALPSFLESPARSLKTNISKEEALKQYQTIKNSEMYDEVLHTYRTSCSLEKETLEIGRIRAFTAGWLERESNFMHMTFKYLYGLLKAKLYDEFFEEIKTNFPPFMNPDVYGRSVFENSSFIATSCNPNPAVHGEGFVARLSGSNTEVLSMWLIMMFGEHPFKVNNNLLTLTLKPVLPIDFFKEKTVKTKFMKSIDVIYTNLTNLHTYDQNVDIDHYELIGSDGKIAKVINSSVIIGEDAIDVRNKKYSQIKVYLGYKK